MITALKTTTRRKTLSKHILILDAGCQLFGQGGTLNHAFTEIAREELTKMGYDVKVSLVDSDYDVKEEASRMIWADTIIVQTPGWWMDTPWQLKKYEDTVWLQPGVSNGDGRSRKDPSKLYGTAFPNPTKTFMISSTWNAPRVAFEDPKQFFEGRDDLDGVFFPLRKAFEFIGFKPLESFMANDVIKNPTIESDMARYREHLKKVFG